jgi:hypothetical protein
MKRILVFVAFCLVFVAMAEGEQVFISPLLRATVNSGTFSAAGTLTSFSPILLNPTEIKGTCTDGAPLCAYNKSFIHRMNLSAASDAINTIIWTRPGGPNFTGNESNFEAYNEILEAPASGANPVYISGVINGVGSVNVGGNGGTYLGSNLALLGQCQLKGSATLWSANSCAEFDLENDAGTSVRISNGILLDLPPNHAVAAAIQNAGILVDRSSGALASLDCAFCVGGYQGYNPISSTGSLFAYVSHSGADPGETMAYGIKIDLPTYTTDAIKTPGFTVDPSGNMAGPKVQTTTIYSAAGTPLPTCNGAAEGTRASVSDATAPTFLGAYASGGTVHAPVYCNGSGWVTG